jgi:hypothetical protein
MPAVKARGAARFCFVGSRTEPKEINWPSPCNPAEIEVA